MANYPAHGSANWDSPLKGYIDAQDADVRADAAADATSKVTAHEAEADPHPQYLLRGSVPSNGDPGDGGGITEHVGQVDPHPQYVTEAYLESRISSHESDTTPHAVYDEGPSFSLLYQNAKV